MSHFYATISQSTRRIAPTACGSKYTGITTITASLSGAILVELKYDKETGKDIFEVRQIPWRGEGKREMLATGILAE